MLEWYRNLALSLDPIAFNIPLLDFGVRWYSLSYLSAFLIGYFLTYHRVKTEKRFEGLDKKSYEDIYFYCLISIVLGGRVGYMLFYDTYNFFTAPWETFKFFSLQGGFHITGISGMSYHGGLLGITLMVFYLSKKYKMYFLHMADLFVPPIPLAYTLGRIANFINNELYGYETTSNWGMRFNRNDLSVLNHPSQLYEAFFEGIVLFVILWSLRKKEWTKGIMGAIYLICYGVFRFFIEIVRLPDEHLGRFFGLFSMGQLLCMAMILSGCLWIYLVRTKELKI